MAVKRLIFLLLIAISLAVGLLIPAYYEWTGSDQNRPSPLLLPTAISLLLGAVVVCCLLPWLPIADDRVAAERGQGQFQIRTILALTAAAAVLLLALVKLPPLAVSGVIQLTAFGYLIRVGVRHRQDRWAVAALLACMYLPYAWVFFWDDLRNASAEILWGALGLPNFFDTLLLGALIDRHLDRVVWVAMLLTSGQLAIGAWIIGLGPRRSIALMIFSLVSSIFGSFILNALVRI